MSTNPYITLPPAPTFTLVSNDVAEGQKLPMAQVSALFEAGGSDVSPHLRWEGHPAETKSFVVTMVDPDAPTVTGFWHWAVANVPGDVTELPSGAGDPSGSKLPAGAFHLPNELRMKQYLGAAPPPGHGTHRYSFAVFALSVDKVDIDPEATPAVLMFTVLGSTLARAVLTAWYER